MTTHETTPPRKQKQRQRWLAGVTVAVGLTGVVTGGALALSTSTDGSLSASNTGAVDRVANHQRQQQSSGNTATNPTNCSPGTLPLVDLARQPEAHATGGAASPEAAVRSVQPNAEQVRTYPFAKVQGAPVWVVADGKTYSARPLKDGTWFLTPATFQRCMPIEETGLEQLSR